jgi:acetoin utilization deacetylase AcuC-like enzyme
MRVLLISHASSLTHDTGVGHPERAARIPAVVEGVRSSGLEVIDLAPPEATYEVLTSVHDDAYVRAIERFCAAGGGALDPDTVAHTASWEAALRAAAAGPTAVGALRSEAADVAFIAMRPPGHHALPARAMGFCLFNNIAITARQLADAGHRVAIVDWDVHHGNSTQDIFFADRRVLYLSMHEFPAYPGTGRADETGTGEGVGMTVNVPWPSGTDGAPYRWATDAVLLPVLDQWKPDWLLVSAGFDAHRADPLAGIRLEADDYRYMAGRLATMVAPRRTVIFLEGGYDLKALTTSTAAALRGFADGTDDQAPPFPAEGPAAQIARRVVRAVSDHWDL